MGRVEHFRRQLRERKRGDVCRPVSAAPVPARPQAAYSSFGGGRFVVDDCDSAGFGRTSLIFRPLNCANAQRAAAAAAQVCVSECAGSAESGGARLAFFGGSLALICILVLAYCPTGQARASVASRLVMNKGAAADRLNRSAVVNKHRRAAPILPPPPPLPPNRPNGRRLDIILL